MTGRNACELKLQILNAYTKNMKRIVPCLIGAAIVCAASFAAFADESLPGRVDFGVFSPPKEGGQYVEINVPSTLIHLASQIIAKDEPEAAKILDGLKLVKVNVIGLNDENRNDLEGRAQKIRKDLSGDGWERVVTVQEKDQDVSVYLKMDGKGSIQGLAAVVINGKDQAVFANVVGDIKPEQLAMLGDKFHIDPLKKLGLNSTKEKHEGGDKKNEDDKSKEKSEN